MEEYGWSPWFERQRNEADVPEGASVGRVVAQHRGSWDVVTSSSLLQAKLRGRVQFDQDLVPCVGDWVVLRNDGNDEHALIEKVFERKSLLSRGSAGRGLATQTIAANIDIVFVVCSLDGDFSLRRIERYLARIFASQATPYVLLTKTDLVEEPGEFGQEVSLRNPDVGVELVSIHDPESIARVQNLLPTGTTGAFVGSSGTGKSTLLNALLGEARMAVGSVRTRDRQGQHTTTHRELVRTPWGALIVDTPGMRELQLTDTEGLGDVFSEISDLAQQCRFGDCAHQSEPGCAVQRAVSEGTLSADRLEHWQSLETEAAANQRRQNEAEHRKHERDLHRLYNTGADARRRKRGER